MIYQKNNNYVLEDTCNRFIYEVFSFIQMDNIFSMAGHKYYSSEQEIKCVESTFVNKFIEIVCELYSAPKQWLLDNDYKKLE